MSDESGIWRQRGSNVSAATTLVATALVRITWLRSLISSGVEAVVKLALVAFVVTLTCAVAQAQAPSAPEIARRVDGIAKMALSRPRSTFCCAMVVNPGPLCTLTGSCSTQSRACTKCLPFADCYYLFRAISRE